MSHIITRREFVKGASIAFLGAAVRFPQESRVELQTSRVVLIRHEGALDATSKVDEDVIQQMLDEAVMKLLGQDSPAKAFSLLVRPGEVVGIKTNVWSYLPTPPEVERGLKRRLIEAGVKEEDIGLDDHTVRTNPLFQKATSLLNVRPLRTHYLAGISGCLKNYIMFAESQPDLHPDSCAELGSLFFLPQVKGKTRLNVLCALTPQYYGRGPHHFNRRYVWAYQGLIIGQDPVAVDAVGLQLIMAKRRQEFGPAQEIPPVPKHIQVADRKYGLGVSDLSRIELVKLGWTEDILI
jgi:hypothetical protein